MDGDEADGPSKGARRYEPIRPASKEPGDDVPPSDEHFDCPAKLNKEQFFGSAQKLNEMKTDESQSSLKLD